MRALVATVMGIVSLFATFPGLAILSVVIGFNFLGDGLRD